MEKLLSRVTMNYAVRWRGQPLLFLFLALWASCCAQSQNYNGNNQLTGSASSYSSGQMQGGQYQNSGYQLQGSANNNYGSSGYSGSQSQSGNNYGSSGYDTSSRPETYGFSCYGKPAALYGDGNYDCRIFHVCQADGRGDTLHCPTKTRFNNYLGVCDWEFKIDRTCMPTYQEETYNTVSQNQNYQQGGAGGGSYGGQQQSMQRYR